MELISEQLLADATPKAQSQWPLAMIRAILSRQLADVETNLIPSSVWACASPVPMLLGMYFNANTWSDKEAYDHQAGDLARRFNENFKQ